MPLTRALRIRYASHTSRSCHSHSRFEHDTCVGGYALWQKYYYNDRKTINIITSVFLENCWEFIAFRVVLSTTIPESPFNQNRTELYIKTFYKVKKYFWNTVYRKSILILRYYRVFLTSPLALWTDTYTRSTHWTLE